MLAKTMSAKTMSSKKMLAERILAETMLAETMLAETMLAECSQTTAHPSFSTQSFIRANVCPHWLSRVEEAGQIVLLFSKLHSLTARLLPPSSVTPPPFPGPPFWPINSEAKAPPPTLWLDEGHLPQPIFSTNQPAGLS